jgi:hypothetical protein
MVFEKKDLVWSYMLHNYWSSGGIWSDMLQEDGDQLIAKKCPAHRQHCFYIILILFADLGKKLASFPEKHCSTL